MSECISPYSVENKFYRVRPNEPQKLPVPCGKCPPCLNRRVSSWAFRLMQEDKNNATATFVTLTYAPEHIRMTKHGLMTLEKKDWQDFMKAYRKSFRYRDYDPVTGRTRQFYDKVPKIKYYVCGEYGSKSSRPHYHAIMFNVDKERLQKHWTLGEIHTGDVTGASVAYTLKYMHKGKVVPVHPRDDRTPEFSLMSKKIGESYLTPQMIQYHQDDISRNYVTLPDGFKTALPRYYRDKIYNDEQKRQQGLKVQQVHAKTESERERRFIQRTGSLVGYTRSKYESRKAVISKHNKENRTGRDKI